ncbi:hypothetical protein ACS04_25985 [Streptomyces roseus]|uniref:Uncharacterized protein n=1 Tax=Streptomyces roseus TaxID=66430 RepID=A0A0J6XGD0_9ACTN|nr:hypothetical protein ACS04_25985 [Streptomyces roseus]
MPRGVSAGRDEQFPASPLARTCANTVARERSYLGEPYSPGFRPPVLCRHVGRVFQAAVPLAASQVVECAREAERLSACVSPDAWQPVAQGFARECPDFS